MTSATVAETRDNLSAIVNDLLSGAETVHVIRKRNKPVAKIVPYSAPTSASRTFGIAKDDGRSIDFEAFDAMDGEIAEEFGA